MSRGVNLMAPAVERCSTCGIPSPHHAPLCTHVLKLEERAQRLEERIRELEFKLAQLLGEPLS